jgi:hypothetical protein
MLHARDIPITSYPRYSINYYIRYQNISSLIFFKKCIIKTDSVFMAT